MNKQLSILDWGLIPYADAWRRQEELFDSIVAVKLQNRKRAEHGETPLPTSNFLVFCQHPHVYTLGKSGDHTNLLIPQAVLAERQIDFYPINRGGDITYHGPGQWVVYPIFDLDNFFTDVHRFLRCLEEAVIQTLAYDGIAAGRITGLTGVWLQAENPEKARKICAMGIRASRWVTMHGLALNVNTNLSYFGYINPCGITDKAVTSMQHELGMPLDMEAVKARLQERLLAQFC